MSKTKFIVTTSVDSDNIRGSFVVITEDLYNKWNNGELPEELDHSDLFGLMNSDLEGVNHVGNEWADVVRFIEDNRGEILNVEACIAY